MFCVQSICSNARGQTQLQHISMHDFNECECVKAQSCVRFKGEAHLEADFALLAAEASQHEEDEGEEARERDGHHSQGRRPGQVTQRSAICRTQPVLQTERCLFEQ